MPPRVNNSGPGPNFIRAWRKHRRMTIQQLADAVGTGKPHLSMVETSKAGLTHELAEALAGALGIDADTLRNRAPDAAPDEAADLRAELLVLFDRADLRERRAIVAMARTVAGLREGTE